MSGQGRFRAEREMGPLGISLGRACGCLGGPPRARVQVGSGVTETAAGN